MNLILSRVPELNRFLRFCRPPHDRSVNPTYLRWWRVELNHRHRDFVEDSRFVLDKVQYYLQNLFSDVYSPVAVPCSTTWATPPYINQVPLFYFGRTNRRFTKYLLLYLTFPTGRIDYISMNFCNYIIELNFENSKYYIKKLEDF